MADSEQSEHRYESVSSCFLLATYFAASAEVSGQVILHAGFDRIDGAEEHAFVFGYAIDPFLLSRVTVDNPVNLALFEFHLVLGKRASFI
jgi:hypothetical protein